MAISTTAFLQIFCCVKLPGKYIINAYNQKIQHIISAHNQKPQNNKSAHNQKIKKNESAHNKKAPSIQERTCHDIKKKDL